MRTFILANCYNEIDNLPRMWESVQANLGEVVLVAVDGKYPDYDAPDDLSTDGTRDYARAEGYLITSTGYECDKRTAGLQFIDTLAEDGDWVLVMDADETLTSIFGWPQRVGYIAFTRHSRPEVTYGRCRLYKWEPGLEFKHRHYDLYDASGELVSSLEDAPDFQPVGTGIHYDKSHSPARIKTKKDYYTQLRKRERHPAEVSV